MRVFIGTYTNGGAFIPEACGEGLMSCVFDERSGSFAELRCAAKIVNPSWIHLDPGGRQLFAVSERFDQPGQVYGFDLTPNGDLTPVSTQSSCGLATCHLTVTEDQLFAASYLDGCLSAYSRQGAQISEALAVIPFSGSGPNVKRQEGSHAHQALVSPCGRWLYVCDLGSDCIRQHELHDETLVWVRDIQIPPGSGPRHLLFHPSKDLAWLVCELSPMILTFGWNRENGVLEQRSRLRFDDHPEFERAGAAAAIHLHPSGKLLGVSDRSAHSICLFSVGESGDLTFQQRIQTGEINPRDFAFSPDGRWLLVAYQDTHGIVSHTVHADLRVDPCPTDRFEVGTPVCIAVVQP